MPGHRDLSDRNHCPMCGGSIPVDAINVQEGVALCPTCGKLSRLSDVANEGRSLAELLDHPPAGCRVDDQGEVIVVNATLRSLGRSLGFFGMALFWNGIVSIFVLVAFAGLYNHLVGPLPTRFPAPDFENGPMPLGMALFFCVFLIPFVVVGLLLLGGALVCAFGRIEVRIGLHEGAVFTGVGGLK